MKIIGYDDSVHTCDCCGKSNLKLTVVVDIGGEILHYGTTCATRHTGMRQAAIEADINQAHRQVVAAAQAEYRATYEYAAEQAAIRAAHAAGIRPGREFADIVRPSVQAAATIRQAIAQKCGLDHLAA